MAKLRVTLIDEVKNRRLKVDLPDDATMEKLLPALAKKLGLPPADYRLTHEATGRALGGDQVLASSGVKEGDVLRLAVAKKGLPVPAWVGIGGVVLLAVAALVFWGDIWPGLKPTPTVVAKTTTPAATSAATPRPTVAPIVPTDTPVLPAKVELGMEDNPIIWSFVPSGEMERVAASAESVADLISKGTGLVIETNAAAEYADVIEAMCSNPPETHMASLDTFSYVLAAAKGCAEAELVSVSYGSPTYNGQIIVRADSGITSIADLAGKTFCRPNSLSTSGWIIPMLSMRAEGINPEADLAEIVDAGSHDAVVAAVYDGECDVGATYVDARDQIEENHPDVKEVVAIIHTSVDIPNDGLQFAPSVPQGIRTKIVDALFKIAETEEGKEALETAYHWSELEKHDDSFYDPFRQVLQASGKNVEYLLSRPKATPVPPTATPVPTSTPRPMATPVPPIDTPVPPTATPVPTSTSTPLPLTYDENFNDPAFDGTYNTGLWSQEESAKGSTSTVEQRDGMLVINQTSGLWESDARLITKEHSNWLLSDLGYIEARLMLDSNFDGESAIVFVQVTSNDTDWFLSCYIIMCKTGRFCTHPWDRPFMNCISPDQYEPDAIGVEYNTWHTARIEVEPETVTFSFYFDGYYFDSFTPPNAAELKDDSFRVEVGVYLEPRSSATGYIDDVRIGK
jgi:phosphonate transport system substrate-binding protein